MTARLLLSLLLCAASGLSAQQAPAASQTECDSCQARHRSLQSLQAARAGAALQQQAAPEQPTPHGLRADVTAETAPPQQPDPPKQ